MRYTKRIAGIAALALYGGTVLVAPHVHAETLPCDLQAAGQKLQSARMTTDNDSLEAIRAALAIRKTILKTLIMCGHDSAVLFRDTVAALSLHDEDMKSMQQSLVNSFNDAIASYNLYTLQASGVGIRGSQDVARALLVWRKDMYLPLEARASHFIIWSNNQDLFDKAGKRILQVSQTMRAIGLIDNENLNDKFSEAKRSFEDAKYANQEAKALLLMVASKDNELSAIKRSLELLAATYVHLFDLSSALGR